MIDFSNFEKINDEAYVWRKFLDNDLADAAYAESDKLSQEKNWKRVVRDLDRVELLGGAMDPRIVSKIKDLFKDTHYFSGSFLHWYTVDDMWFGMHRDDEAYDPTPFKKVWAGVLYLADMDGGELLYPTENSFVKPQKGDLVIHTAVIPHAAVPVSSGNKRTITFVVYDRARPIDPSKEPHGEEVAALKDKQVMASTDWLDSHFGKMWRKDYNIDLTRNEEVSLFAKRLDIEY
jgi:hypothetical protein